MKFKPEKKKNRAGDSGSCYTAQEAGTVKVTSYSNRRKLSLDQDISLTAKMMIGIREIYGIHSVDVQGLVEDETPLSN